MANENDTINDWTIMFFFASDMELSPLTVSQIKAVKDAGYQKSTEVLLYFDSNEQGVPTRLFNMNKGGWGGRYESTQIGDGADPYIRSFLDDEIMPDAMDGDKGKCTNSLKTKLTEPDTMNATKALENFIGYCQENSPAKHYLLFLVGHGMVVANDTFLYDEHPRSSIALNDFGDLIRNFTKTISGEGSLELICLHSCSMSSIEVAYELRDTAKYMIASEGYSYVGSWPYRQLLKKIFNTTHEAKDKPLDESAVQTLIQKIYELTLYNAPDFAYSGYSHDLTLCSLDGPKIERLVEHLRKLTGYLKQSLKTDRGQQLILLAHLKSQAFWRDEYTDIYDFCRCLKELCDQSLKELNDFYGCLKELCDLKELNDCHLGVDASLKEVSDSCQAVMDEWEQQPEQPFDRLVVLSDNFGWQYQFAHGLSIYFPWIRPLSYDETGPFENYQNYAFNQARENSWDTFLEAYWKKTMRAPEKEDEQTDTNQTIQVRPSHLGLPISPVGAYNKPGGGYNKPGGSMADSPCICPSFKNFPMNTKLGRRTRGLPPMTARVEKAVYKNPEPPEPRNSRPEE